jgi:hypothetical protein
LPSNFWPQVDALTAKLASMLLPLVKLMDKHFEASRNKSLRLVYQDLHHIVAEAGFLAVGIRHSRTIFRFSWPVLGLNWDSKEQNHAEGDVYDLSKEMAAIEDEEHKKNWEIEQNNKLKEAQAASSSILSDGGAATGASENSGRSAIYSQMHYRGLHAYPTRVVDASENDGDDVAGRGLQPSGSPSKATTSSSSMKPAMPTSNGSYYYPPSRMARVQIVMWPMMQRYVTHGRLSEPDGESIADLCKAQVVYYSGLADDNLEDAASRPGLDGHLSNKHWSRMFAPMAWPWWSFLTLAITAVYIAAVAIYGADSVVQSLANFGVRLTQHFPAVGQDTTDQALVWTIGYYITKATGRIAFGIGLVVFHLLQAFANRIQLIVDSLTNGVVVESD